MKRTMKRLAAAVVAASILLAFGAGNVQARDQIRIVGSSTVYPFASYVCEEFGATTGHPTPVIESIGSGGGMKLFSEGLSLSTPDISNASRRMKLSEYERNMENGVEPTTETIYTGEYPVARSLYFYVKLDHIGEVPGIEEYVDLFLSEKMIGSRGYLKRQGLIPMPEQMREEQRQEWENRELLQKADLME